MADIAMLVAEEYERRVKNARKSQGVTLTTGANDEEIGLFPRVSISAKRVDLQGSFSLMMMKNKIGEVRMDLVKRAFEPKSEVGDAATNCFFSA